MEEMEEEEFLTIQEAAIRIGVSDSAVRNAINEERLNHIYRYGKKLIRVSDAEEYKLRTQVSGQKPSGRPKKTIDSER